MDSSCSRIFIGDKKDILYLKNLGEVQLNVLPCRNLVEGGFLFDFLFALHYGALQIFQDE